MGFFESKNTPEYAIKQEMNAKVAFINQKYMDIGRYVKLNLSDSIENEELKNILLQIDRSLEDLKILTTNLNTVRGIKICPNCKNEISVNMVFCHACGAKQENMPAPTQQQFVPQQQAYQQPVYQQSAVPAMSAPQPTEQQVGVIPDTPRSQPAPIDTQFIYCTQCGSKEPVGMKFCSNCGSPL